MALHDAYLRLTPFELTFPDADAANEFTSVVATAMEAAGVDAADRRAFVTFDTVSAYLRRIRPGGGEGGGPGATYDYALLLYHAFHFARRGFPSLLVSEETARALVAGREDRRPPPAALTLPAPAGYTQLPRNLFWTRRSPEAAAEAVDGFFWCLGDAGMLYVLMAAGMREDRPGFAVVPVPEAPWSDAVEWLGASVRPEGDDFATTLPGGEMDELYSFTTAGEVLKLAARLFARLQSHADVPVREPPASGTGAATADASTTSTAPSDSPSPAPSSFSYRRI